MIEGFMCFGILIMVCQDSRPQTPAVNSYCQVSKIIRPSRKDTEETLRQIATENAKFKRLCPEAKK